MELFSYQTRKHQLSLFLPGSCLAANVPILLLRLGRFSQTSPGSLLTQPLCRVTVREKQKNSEWPLKCKMTTVTFRIKATFETSCCKWVSSIVNLCCIYVKTIWTGIFSHCFRFEYTHYISTGRILNESNMIQEKMSVNRMTDKPDLLQISFVLPGELYCRSPAAGQTGAAAGHEGCTPYL